MNMRVRPDSGLRKAVSEMPMRIRRAYKDWENAPDHIQQRGVRIEVTLGDVDPLRWLLAQRFQRLAYWSARDGAECIAGVGSCHECSVGTVSHPEALFAKGREVLSHFGNSKPKYIGGFSFSEHSVDEAPWPEMGQTRFWIPFAEICKSEDKIVLACNLYFRRNVNVPVNVLIQEWQAIHAQTHMPDALPTLICRRDFPEREGWDANVRSALDLIDNGVLDKVVLARKAEYHFASLVSAVQILAILEQVTSHCYHFLIQPSPRAAFMGTTPERLYRREGRALKTEALAGTRPRGKDEEEDQRLGAELLESTKERHEQELVRRDLMRQLHLLSDTVEAEEQPQLLQLERKQHLLSLLSAVLRNKVDDAELIKSLHPTPAVGGSPRENALRELTRLEPFSRGWYAAPVGCFGEDFAEFAVAIRSGMVQDKQVNIYSGAGIVQGSQPEEEWQEIENKISDFVKVTGGGIR
ncbi:isochorismate synthase [Kiritimatiellota bacterium B12222]|nr:isochorismate synthase [Kiritimatiellota bacterium B12222]